MSTMSPSSGSNRNWQKHFLTVFSRQTASSRPAWCAYKSSLSVTHKHICVESWRLSHSPAGRSQSAHLSGFLHSVSQERCLVLTVVEQDIKGHLVPHQVVDSRLHQAVEVSGWVRVVQHVADLRHIRRKSRLTSVFPNVLLSWGLFVWLTLYFVPSISSGSSLTSDLRARPKSGSLLSESVRKCSRVQ